MHRRVVALVAAAMAAACSASGPKSPTEDLDDPADTVEGSWTLQMFAVQSATVGGCPQSIQASLELDDVAKTAFTGMFQTSTIMCSGPPVDTLIEPSGSVTNGSVTPDSIKFTIGNGAFVGWPINGGWQGDVTFRINAAPQQVIHASWAMAAYSHMH